jgi:hypothetical protein
MVVLRTIYGGTWRLGGEGKDLRMNNKHEFQNIRAKRD